MRSLTGLLDDVAGVLKDVAAEVLEPCFARCNEINAWEKSAGEVVTAADVEAEHLLSARLGELLPGVPVVGEEATAAELALPAALLAEAPRVWLVDPLDGTANFVAGSADWAVMVALVEHGVTVASWMWRPVDKRLFVAERGAGAWADGRRLVCPPAPTAAGDLTGAVLTRFLDDAMKCTLASNAHRFAKITPGRLCLAVDYPMIATGDPALRPVLANASMGPCARRAAG